MFKHSHPSPVVFPLLLRRAGATVALALLAAASLPVVAQSVAQSGGGFSLGLGAGEHHQRATLAYQTPTFWQSGRLEAVGEFSLSYWHAQGSRSPDSLWQLGATPLLRWWTHERFFVEAGIGVNAFSRTRFANRTISTAFQFGEHLGVGWRLGQDSQVGLRVSHFSNASIKRPNSGLNSVQVRYLQAF